MITLFREFLMNGPRPAVSHELQRDFGSIGLSSGLITRGLADC